MRPILLDTCAAVWLANRSYLLDDALRALEAMQSVEGGIVVSPITAWEVGRLVAVGRLILTLDTQTWFGAVLNAGVRLAEMPPEVLLASATLPGAFLRDPVDRILAATARTYGYRLMTPRRDAAGLCRQGAFGKRCPAEAMGYGGLRGASGAACLQD